MTFAEAMKSYKAWYIGLACLLIGLYYSIFGYMVKQWYNDDNYSHGFFIPLISAYFLYQRRETLKNCQVEPWWPGMLVIVFGLVQLVVGWVATELFTMRSSLIVVLAGMVLYFFGKQVFKTALLPILFLFFMIPLPYIVYDAAAFPLKLFVTKVSVGFLKAMGIVVLREGNIILLPGTSLEVADACSGIRSLISLLALSVAYAFAFHKAALKRWIIILSAIPIAIFTNSMRVIVTGILAQYWGAGAAEGFFHEFAGFAVFAVAMVMLIALGALLNRKG